MGDETLNALLPILTLPTRSRHEVYDQNRQSASRPPSTPFLSFFRSPLA